MRALILDGTSESNFGQNQLSETVVTELKSVQWDVENLVLPALNIISCQGCFGCWTRTPGVCVIKDDAREVAGKVVRSDLVVLITPVTFGGYSAELKKIMDRLIPLISPFFTKIRGEVHHKPRYEKYPRLVAVGILPVPDADSEHLFKTLVSRNALNFHSPAYAAGVVSGTNGSAEVKGAVRELLAQVGVSE
ncbi:MAG: flavodoxin family protein [Candidatus Desulforudis sp.]|nr:flavodoxin family protein [Desulforudis sp.]